MQFAAMATQIGRRIITYRNEILNRCDYRIVCHDGFRGIHHEKYLPAIDLHNHAHDTLNRLCPLQFMNDALFDANHVFGVLLGTKCQRSETLAAVIRSFMTFTHTEKLPTAVNILRSS